MLKQEIIYDFVKEECRKQYLSGGIKGVDANTVAVNVNMQRSNVVNQFKKLIDMKLIYKSNGRPVLYYVDSSIVEYEIKSQEEVDFFNIDKYLEHKSKNLIKKGFNKEEIRRKITREVNDYIKGFLEATENRGKSEENIILDKEYVVGVESNSNKTIAIAYDKYGNEISSGEAGLGNLVINKEEALKNIEFSILKCISNLDEKRCIHLYCGLPGVDTGNNKFIIKKYLEERFPISITVMNDAELTLNSVLKGRNGILVISELGSIIYSKNNESKLRYGGYGPILGDKGSIYYVVLKSFEIVIEEKELENSFSNLSINIMNSLECKTISEFVEKVYSLKQEEILRVFLVIVNEYKNGNEKIIKIFAEAGRYLGKLTCRAYKLLENQEEIPIAIKGDLINKVPIVKQFFINEINKVINNYKIIKPNVKAAKGAYYIEFNKSRSWK
ncbi:BadF/BadG/BcrA/BcrD ATPase family protein [Clostridium sp. HCS.1]|uniref:BadF/BadG/BcrA/BcrD ATPase family protein n=1 Tax=Clostridium sp. HCS.1 TaxID=3238594 RepID=UPI003A0FC7AF